MFLYKFRTKYFEAKVVFNTKQRFQNTTVNLVSLTTLLYDKYKLDKERQSGRGINCKFECYEFWPIA